ncbi:MAG TPA: VOC family protein [Candidatus Bathyarchaeia archaeon]|nr:VOC family protein [Candidatus Bathyarchaeia archaeon]
MAIRQIGLGWITVADLKKAEAFFAEKLGLTITNSSPEWGWLEVKGTDGGISLGIGQAQPDSHAPKPGHNTILTFTVDDIVETRKELQEKGVTFVDEIMEVPGHVKLTTFVDNDNNIFQLAQPLGK